VSREPARDATPRIKRVEFSGAIGMEGQGRTSGVDHGAVGIGMVKMCMRVEDILDSQPPAVDFSQDTLRVTTGVYDQAFLRLLTTDHIAVGLDQPHGQCRNDQ